MPASKSRYLRSFLFMPSLVFTLLLRLLECRGGVAASFVSKTFSMPSRRTASTILCSARRILSVNEERETVAIIGGGIAGLTCAQYLCQSGRFRPTVFDTGRLRPGGRCSSRRPEDKDSHNSTTEFKYLKSSILDHAAQILTVPANFPEFQHQVDEWEREGTISRYPKDAICNILYGEEGNAFQLQPLNTETSDKPMYFGTTGMGSIPLRISRDVDLRQDVWVSPSNGVRYQKESGKWKLQSKSETLGIFDRLVIAHNGKCADRIMSQTPAKLVHNLLRVNFAPSVPEWGGKRMTLNSIYSLTFAIDENALKETLTSDKFVCGFIKNEPILRFLTCQSRKYPRINNNKHDSSVEVWTLLSSGTFAKKHKAPQESLPDDVVQNVTSLMLQALEKSLGLAANSLVDHTLQSRLQLWGAAVPMNIWTSDCRNSHTQKHGPSIGGGYLYDGRFGVGVCGDWLVEPSIAGAWESGRRLAEYMINQRADSRSLVGVKGAFQASPGSIESGIGSLT